MVIGTLAIAIPPSPAIHNIPKPHVQNSVFVMPGPNIARLDNKFVGIATRYAPTIP